MFALEKNGRFAKPKSFVTRHAMPALSIAASAQSGGDLVRSYLRDIGRVPLLSHEQEITLGRQVK